MPAAAARTRRCRSLRDPEWYDDAMNGDSVPDIVVWERRINVTKAVASANVPASSSAPKIASTPDRQPSPHHSQLKFAHNTGVPSRAICSAPGLLGRRPGRSRIRFHSRSPETATAVAAATATEPQRYFRLEFVAGAIHDLRPPKRDSRDAAQEVPETLQTPGGAGPVATRH